MHPILAQRRRLGLYLVSWTPVAVVLTAMLALSAGSSWPEAIALTVPLLIIYAFLCLGAWYACRALPLRHAALPKALGSHLLTALLSASVWVGVALGLAWLLDRDGLFPGARERIAGQVGPLLALGVVLYLLSVAVHYLLTAAQASRDAERRALRAELAATEAELRALKAQIDPHFLFNSLNSISALVTSEPKAAREMCIRLGDFLRATLRLGALETIPLRQEMEMVERFLHIERVRFGARLEVDIQSDESCLDCTVPSLLLQPLVENALKHGIANLVEGGTVRIEASRKGDTLRLAVENPVDPDPAPSRGAGVGQANVRERLASMYGDRARLRVRRDEGTFRVEALLPAAAPRRGATATRDQEEEA
jgi:hypothetical protein